MKRYAHSLLVVMFVACVAGAQGQVFWTDHVDNLVERAALDGSGRAVLIDQPASGFHDIAVVPVDRKIYWANGALGTISRANLNGSGVETVVNVANPHGLAVDTKARRLYWTDPETDKIQRSDLDGANVEDLVAGLQGPFGIALDLAAGKMYWTDQHAHKIQRADLDGSNVEDVLATGAPQPQGIALDILRGKVYWVDTAQRVRRANLDGTGVEDVLFAGGPGLHWMDLDPRAGKIYWCQANGPSAVRRANLDGSNVEDIAAGQLPIGVALDIPNQAPTTAAPANFTLLTSEQGSTVIAGTVSDADGDDLRCWWIHDGVRTEGTIVSGTCSLDLATLPALAVGDHTFTLLVTDGFTCSSSSVVVTVENSPPVGALTGAGVYEIGPGTNVPLGGQVSDFDGDLLVYQWKRVLGGGGTEVLSGPLVIATVAGGGPVNLPVFPVATQTLGVGVHTILLVLDDGTNEAVEVSTDVEVVDTTVPTLSVTSSHSILWPPNHKMVEVTLETEASDNSGAPVQLGVVIESSEPSDGQGDGNTEPDFEVLEINQETGVIRINLRAERSGTGDGRTYTITVSATDGPGQTSIVVLEIVAPHSKGKKK